MDLATVGGLILAIVSLVVTVFLEGGSLGSLWGPSAFFLIVGGTLGATFMSHRTAEAIGLPRVIVQAFRSVRTDPAPIVAGLVALAEKARRQGLLSLQDDPNNSIHPLATRGVAMVVDGLDAEVIDDALANDLALREEAGLAQAAVLETAGGYAPTIGIIGTVFGLINVLSNLSDAESLGHSIAVAFLATFYGIATANLFWLPLAAKVKRQAGDERRLGEMVIIGITSLQAGEHPRSIQEKLAVYLPPVKTAKPKPAAEAVGQEAEA